MSTRRSARFPFLLFCQQIIQSAVAGEATQTQIRFELGQVLGADTRPHDEKRWVQGSDGLNPVCMPERVGPTRSTDLVLLITADSGAVLKHASERNGIHGREKCG